jgi:hypothetical protein
VAGKDQLGTSPQLEGKDRLGSSPQLTGKDRLGSINLVESNVQIEYNFPSPDERNYVHNGHAYSLIHRCTTWMEASRRARVSRIINIVGNKHIRIYGKPASFAFISLHLFIVIRCTALCCVFLLGYLATIESHGEQDFLIDLLATHRAKLPDCRFANIIQIWFGASDHHREGIWNWHVKKKNARNVDENSEWIEQPMRTYTNWGKDEPNGGNHENCLSIEISTQILSAWAHARIDKSSVSRETHQKIAWNDLPCATNGIYIIEYNILDVSSDIYRLESYE